MKCLSCAIVMALTLLSAGCESEPAQTGAELTSSAPDSVGILDYTSSGRLDKAIPAREDVTTGSITIAVDETLKPIIEAEIAAFEFLFPDAKIHALYLPGEEAIAAMLSSDSVRMVISTRELRPEEEGFLGKRNIAPKYAHLFSDAVAVITHPSQSLEKLDMDQLEGLLKGEISDWQDLVPGAQSLETSLVVDNRASSTLMTLRNRFAEGAAFNNPAVYALDSTVEVIDYVADNPGAIGFVGIAWMSDVDDPAMRARRNKVTLLSLERSEVSDSSCLASETYFLPYQSYIYQGCYPLSRSVISVLRESTLGLGTGFVSYMDSPKGQLVIHKAGLATVHGISRRVKLPPKTDLDNSE